jgi:MtN3 and saliva related transmembrane protein
MDFLLPAIGFVATGFAVSSTVPQISKALKTKKSDDISLRFIVVLIIGLSFWVIYGIGKMDVVLIMGNSIAVDIEFHSVSVKNKIFQKSTKRIIEDKSIPGLYAAELIPLLQKFVIHNRLLKRYPSHK